MLSKTGYEKGSNTSSTSVSYNPREEVESVTWNTNNSTSLISYTRDFLRRIKTSTYKVNSGAILTTTYNYLEVDKYEAIQGNDTTTNVLSSVVNRYNNTNYTYSYDFDDFGNITSITNSNGNKENTYVYDKLNQLVRENNKELNKTYTFEYDNGGNLKVAKTYNYTAGDITGNPISKEEYTYGDSNWKDLLTGYKVTENNVVTVNGTIVYDNIGNPTKYYDNKQFTWSFRRLEQIKDGSNTYSYTYNQDGIRTSKTVNGTKTNYIVSGNRILQETSGSNTIIYEYDALGNASSFVYNGTRYIYVRNGTNDVVGILNSSGNLVASYMYDGWGNCTVNNSAGSTIGTINPIRYRSYYYDSETGYYYLNSRYYDSNVGRFISADSHKTLVASIMQVNDVNFYTYCDNNPINRIDIYGNVWDTIFDVASLGMSIVEVAINPADPWAWAGLAGDIIDMVPFVTGVGEIVDGVKYSRKLADTTVDVVEETMNLYRSNKNFSKITGAYEITFKSGNSYVGKGGLKRAITSAKDKSKKYVDEVVDIKWVSAKNKRDAFIKEHIIMTNNAAKNKTMYNKIASPGRKYFLEEMVKKILGRK